MSEVFETNTAAATYHSLRNVKTAVIELEKSGFDLRRVSIAGKGHHYDGGRADWNPDLQPGRWKEVSKLASGKITYLLSDKELVMVSGPLSQCVAAAFDNPIIFEGLSTLCAAMYMLGIPRSKALKFQEDLQNDNFLVIANGTADEVALATRIFHSINGD